jgi:Methyltransferase domain
VTADRDPAGVRAKSRSSRPDVVRALLRDRPAFHLQGEAHWGATPQTLEAIRALVRPGDATIEIGVGASTVVFASQGAEHTAVSPDPEEHRRVREYCHEIGVEDDHLRFVLGHSDDVLPSLLGYERTLDLALIDGAHSFPFPELDWHYVSRALKIGGTLIMDDIPIPAVSEVFRHMRLEPHWRLVGLLDDRAAAFRLLAAPPPEVWMNQGYNRAYPDFGFAALPRRLRLRAAFKSHALRHGLAQRFPALSALYKRLR